jgi:hypothetical protein
MAQHRSCRLAVLAAHTAAAGAAAPRGRTGGKRRQWGQGPRSELGGADSSQNNVDGPDEMLRNAMLKVVGGAVEVMGRPQVGAARCMHAACVRPWSLHHARAALHARVHSISGYPSNPLTEELHVANAATQHEAWWNQRQAVGPGYS